jgi:hypothetical protein
MPSVFWRRVGGRELREAQVVDAASRTSDAARMTAYGVISLSEPIWSSAPYRDGHQRSTVVTRFASFTALLYLGDGLQSRCVGNRYA